MAFVPSFPFMIVSWLHQDSAAAASIEELSDLVLLEDIAIYCLTNKDFISWGDMTIPGP